MAHFIILTAEQADHVRGPTITPGFLNPIERDGGWFILPAAVLDDPLHEERREYLLGLPQLDSADPAFPPPLTLPEE